VCECVRVCVERKLIGVLNVSLIKYSGTTHASLCGGVIPGVVYGVRGLVRVYGVRFRV
jgi:hypothetical protein